MNRRQIALWLVLEELGIRPSLSLMDDRLILQRAVYLVQHLGFALGYAFSWSPYGPYSRELAADGFALLTATAPEGWALDSAIKRQIGYIRGVLEQLRERPNEAATLELLASVLFVLKTGQGFDAETVRERLRMAGKDYPLEVVDNAIRTVAPIPAEPQGTAG